MPYGATVTRIRRTAGGSWADAEHTPLQGLVVSPETAESRQWVVLGPINTPLKTGDRVAVDGELMEVIRDPVRFRHPMSGWEAGTYTPVAVDPLPEMNDRCEVREQGSWGDAGYTPGGVVAEWRGASMVPFTVIATGGVTESTVGAQATVPRTLRVMMPWDVPGELVGRVLHVTSSATPFLHGKTLAVASEAVGERPLARIVEAILQLTPHAAP